MGHGRFEYGRMWAFHNIAIIQMEGDRTNPNPTHTIFKWAS